MTLPSTPRRAGPYTGTGVLLSYPFTFKVFAKEDLQVVTADTNGLETIQVIDSGALVTLNVDQDATPGGSVRYAVGGVATALPTGYRLAITGAGLDYDQPADLPQGGAFNAENVEDAFDRTEMQIQNLLDKVDRSVTVGVTSATSLALPAPVAGQLLGWNTTLDGLVNYAPDASSAAGLQIRLANPASPVDGSALVAFNYAMGYAAGSIGRWLKDLALSTGAGFIGWIQSGTGAVLRTVSDRLRDQVCVFDYMTAAQIADVKAGTLTLDVTVAVQAAIDANYGRTIFFPKGAYRITAELTLLVYANAGTNNIGIHLKGECMGPASGTTSGTRFQVVGAVNGINVYNSTAFNGDARILIEDLFIYGDGTNAAGGSGIIANLANNLLIRNVFISDMRQDGVYLYRCYGAGVEDSTILRCRRWGIWAQEAFNLGTLRNLKIYGCGRNYSSGVQGGVRLSGPGNENLGVIIDNVDVSYTGASAFSLLQRSNASLTNITVAAGVATANTLAAHGRTTGETVSVVGATADPNLNTTYSAVITVTGANAFTFATSAANGTYTDAGLVIGPAAYGFFLDSTRGLAIKGYAEDCVGPALYLGSNVRSFEVVGGYWQGAGMGCVIISDSAQNGRFAAMYLSGAQAKLLVSVAAGPHNVDVASNITLAFGAVMTLPTLYMRDGQYYSNAAPTTGTWTGLEKHVRQSTPTVGNPKGWYRTVAGTPGTWVSEGNL